MEPRALTGSASAEGGAGEVVWGEMIAGAADGFDDIGVADGLEFAAEGADAGRNGVASRRVSVSEDCCGDDIAREGTVWVLNKVFQEQAFVVVESR